MPKVEAWYCTHDDKLFITKKEYLDNLKDIAWHRFRERQADICDARITTLIANRKEHVKSPGDLKEFIDENWELIHKYVMWSKYTSPKQVIFEYRGCSVSYYKTIYDDGPKMTLLVDLDIIDSNKVMSYNYLFLSALGLNFYSHYNSYNTYICTPGEWELLNLPAKEDYLRQHNEWQEKEEIQAIFDKLNGRSHKPTQFTYKGIHYAEGTSISVSSY